MLRQDDQAASHYRVALKVNSNNADGGERKKKDFFVDAALAQVYDWQGGLLTLMMLMFVLGKLEPK